jgi:hypothetical protein
MTMTHSSSNVPAARRCQEALNSLHSTIYFSPDLGEELAGFGVTDPMGVYLAGRAAPLGAVAAGTVTATFYGFHHDLIAHHFPAMWELVAPRRVVASRMRAADATLRRCLGSEILGSPQMAEAAALASRAAEACARPGRPMSAALGDQDVPAEPHLALWHSATRLREYRGDGHVIALQHAGLSGLEALVSHCASSAGMPKEMVRAKRGWSVADWAGAEDTLRRRGLMTEDGALTERGVRLRAELESETDRLDLAPYARLGAADTERLTRLVEGFNAAAVAAGAFPEALLATFARR